MVGVFPSRDAYIRLVTSYLIEYSEDWPKIIEQVEQKRSEHTGKTLASQGFKAF